MPMLHLTQTLTRPGHAAIVGDITPQDGISKVDKNRMETDAINQMTSLLGKQAAGRPVLMGSCASVLGKPAQSRCKWCLGKGLSAQQHLILASHCLLCKSSHCSLAVILLGLDAVMLAPRQGQGHVCHGSSIHLAACLLACCSGDMSSACDAGDDIRSLWQEYEDCSTPEAALVKDYDKVSSPHMAASAAVATSGWQPPGSLCSCILVLHACDSRQKACFDNPDPSKVSTRPYSRSCSIRIRLGAAEGLVQVLRTGRLLPALTCSSCCAAGDDFASLGVRDHKRRSA